MTSSSPTTGGGGGGEDEGGGRTQNVPPDDDDDDMLECGTSLAETAWAEEGGEPAAVSTSMAPPPTTTTTSTSSEEDAATATSNKDDDDRGKAAGRGSTVAVAAAAAAAAASSSCTPSIDERIGSLRNRLASDVVGVPTSPTSPSSTTSQQKCQTFPSPFEHPPNTSHHPRVPLVYCDQTASNRPVTSIESYLHTTCLPYYGNTHTNTSLTGCQSTAFVAESRQIVAEVCNARITGKAAVDVVLFAGNGATGCVDLLIDVLGIRGLNLGSGSGDGEKEEGDDDKRPVVFVGPHEHHSNIVPWRESGCEIVSVPEHPTNGTVDLAALDVLLQQPKYDGRIKMGTFSVASNVTGLLSDADQIAAVLHKHGALAFFDGATGVPYGAGLDVNPRSIAGSELGDCSKDALYFSPHKCYGGINTPGVLILKKKLVSQINPPKRCGGGTVFYVTNDSHRFLSNRIERYEGGTPDVVGVQRVGLVLLASRKVREEYRSIVQDASASANAAKEEGATTVPKTLLEHEIKTHRFVVQTLRETSPNLYVLGSSAADDDFSNKKIQEDGGPRPQLPIFSFLIQCGKRFLHYNYVCAILNDVFGIQSRGGCQCAGPYSQRLLGLTTTTTTTTKGEEGRDEESPNAANRRIERALLRHKERAELLRPGYTRLSLPFKGLRDVEVRYVLRALEWVSKHGWALMPQYICDHRTGEWRHHSRRGRPLGKEERRWLSWYDPSATFSSSSSGVDDDNNMSLEDRLDESLRNADAILDHARHDRRAIAEALSMNDAGGILGGGTGGEEDDGDSGELEDLRWYVYPKECAELLRDGGDGNVVDVPPGTMDSNVISGAVRPRGFCPPLSDGTPHSSPTSQLQQREGGDPVISMAEEQWQGDADGTTTPAGGGVEPMAIEDRADAVDGTEDTDDSALVIFRECDHHSGEAPLDEIKAGYDDGELTARCELYDRIGDVWLPIEEYLRSRRKKAKTESSLETPPVPPHSSDAQTSSSSGNGTGVQPMEEEEKEATSNNGKGQLERGKSQDIASDMKTKFVRNSEKKKPSRDSSTWGRSSIAHLSVQLSAPDKSSKEEPEHAPPSAILPDKDDNKSPTAATIESTLHGAPPISNKKKKNAGKLKPPPKMMRYITQAMIQWDMVKEGDRLLLGLSGGKDSLSLLHCLLEFQRKLPIDFSIEVCTIDPMTPSFDPSPLIPYVESLGLKYHYIRDDIVARANTSGKDGKVVSSLCSFCARMKRGNLYSCARKNNCNKLVLAQHLDDCAESFLMSVMHNGFIRTMKAHYQINAGDIAVIRPMVYCRESLMTEFAKSANLPVINENCPACFEEPKERARVKKLLSREETLYPNLYDNIRRAMIPLMHDDSTSIMRCYLEETIAKSRKVPSGSKGNKAKPRGKKEDGGGARCTTQTAQGACEVNKESETATILNKGSSPAEGIGQNHGSESSAARTLTDASEEELIAELARRRAERFKLSGAMKRLERGGNDDGDPTGQVCSLQGGNDTIPCTELME